MFELITSEILENFSAKTIVVLLGAFLFGFIAAFIALWSKYFRTPKKLRQRITIKMILGVVGYCFLGGLAAAIFQAISTTQEVYKIQAVTIGLSWPNFVHSYQRKSDFDSFVSSDEDVEVETK